MAKKTTRYLLVARGETTRYLLIMWGDIEATLRGPYKTDVTRDAAARRFRRQEGDEHGIHGLDVLDGKPRVWDYPGGFFQDE